MKELFHIKIKPRKKRERFAPVTKQETNRKAYNRKQKHPKKDES